MIQDKDMTTSLSDTTELFVEMLTVLCTENQLLLGFCRWLLHLGSYEEHGHHEEEISHSSTFLFQHRFVSALIFPGLPHKFFITLFLS